MQNPPGREVYFPVSRKTRRKEKQRTRRRKRKDMLEDLINL